MPFKKQIPADLAQPTVEPNAAIAGCTYKNLWFICEGTYLIRYYNCSLHWYGWESARDKYNSLTSVK
jgi:hypothetical protein